MRAYIIEKYKAKFKETKIPKPTPKEDEILIKVKATSINPLDYKLKAGKLKLLYPLKFPCILGFDVAGIANKQKLYGITEKGANAEYTTSKKESVAQMPSNISFEEAASLPVAGLTALQSLKNMGKIKPNDRVLIIGASGGVGSLAVQIAKAYEAKVTGICHSNNISFVEKLGADEVQAYNKKLNLKTYDIIFDASGKYKYCALTKHMTPYTAFITTLPILSNFFWGIFVNMLTKRRSRMIRVKSTKEDLEELTKLIEEGKVKPIIAKTFPITKLEEAHKYTKKGVKGKVVIKI